MIDQHKARLSHTRLHVVIAACAIMIKGGMRLRTSVWSARWLVHRAAHQQRAFALPRSGGGGGGGGGRGGTPADEEEVAAARKWLAKFDADTIPRSICDISFSRSSGPGGQNVNKCVNASGHFGHSIFYLRAERYIM